MNGGYEMFVLRQLTEAAEASRRHAGMAGRTSRLRRWLDRRAAARTRGSVDAGAVVRVPRQRTSPEAVEVSRSSC